MNPSLIVIFAVGMLLIAGGQCLVCSPWANVNQALVYKGPSGTCHRPEIHVSGNNWRLCCDSFSTRTLGYDEPVEPLVSERTGARLHQKCTRWMDQAKASRVALARDACSTSLVSQMKDGEMRICCV